jgi:hypothetical protein
MDGYFIIFVVAIINTNILKKRGASLFRTQKRTYRSALIKISVSRPVGNKGGKYELSGFNP